MSNPAKKRRPAPVSIRFSEVEKTLLRRKAGSLPLGTYVRDAVLGDAAAPRLGRRQPITDGEPLGRLLGLLGQSRLANNLNQLAKAVNTGSLPVTPETEADLRRACAEVDEMRSLLLQALGIERADGSAKSRSLTQSFARMAEPHA